MGDSAARGRSPSRTSGRRRSSCSSDHGVAQAASACRPSTAAPAATSSRSAWPGHRSTRSSLWLPPTDSSAERVRRGRRCERPDPRRHAPLPGQPLGRRRLPPPRAAEVLGGSRARHGVDLGELQAAVEQAWQRRGRPSTSCSRRRCILRPPATQAWICELPPAAPPCRRRECAPTATRSLPSRSTVEELADGDYYAFLATQARRRRSGSTAKSSPGRPTAPRASSGRRGSRTSSSTTRSRSSTRSTFSASRRRWRPASISAGCRP